MQTPDGPPRVHPVWIVGIIVAGVAAILFGIAVAMFLVIGIAMGGDALGPAYGVWATAAFIAYPVIVLVIVIAASIWGITTLSDNRRVLALIAIALAVPLAVAVALALTFIGVAVSK